MDQSLPGSDASFYGQDFYFQKRASTLQSATAIMPALFDVFQPVSVVDVGAGDCAWGLAFLEAGIVDYVGIDGEHARSCVPQCLANRFFAANLASDAIAIHRRFDLVLSLEVAEHIAIEHADSFVGHLIGLGDIVLFSAAIPGQGGSNHVNEQWQGYWAAKFLEVGYQAFDLIRPAIWDDTRIAEYYRQNIILYCNNENAELIGLLQAKALRRAPIFNIVHPDNYERLCQLENAPLASVLRALPLIVRRVLRNRLIEPLAAYK